MSVFFKGSLECTAIYSQYYSSVDRSRPRTCLSGCTDTLCYETCSCVAALSRPLETTMTVNGRSCLSKAHDRRKLSGLTDSSNCQVPVCISPAKFRMLRPPVWVMIRDQSGHARHYYFFLRRFLGWAIPDAICTKTVLSKGRSIVSVSAVVLRFTGEHQP